jgi:SIR2-like domain
MRFLPGGPSIPEELLQASDRGDVIFLCGAGVSRPAGLPGFLELARLVIEKLGAPADAASRQLLERILGDSQAAVSLDQVFQNLKYEYGADEIDEVVSGLLDAGAGANVEHHALLLKLSRSAAGRPQIVTTNFDLLFERADPSLTATAIVAPNLPDLANGQPMEGIVYLHGRRKNNDDSRKAAPLIVGSADFGRAYLAQGWATKFMTDLLRHYTIVLVGYSANDPPVRYLLEGIHALGDGRPSRLYAFDRGSPEAVQARWRDRGVRVLAYPDTDTEHASLWGTLREWSDRAEDVDRWRRSTAKLASQRPSALRPYQRGQVASLVRTDGGAKVFRESAAIPPAEWLCVFDRNLRFAKPHKERDRRSESDPLILYRLDDDPPRPESTDRDGRLTPLDLVTTLGSEACGPPNIRLAGGALRGAEPITARLFHLAHWIARLLDDPVSAWWAAGYETLHPRLISLIEWRIENPETKLHPLAYRVWRLLLERFRQGPRDSFGERWFPFARLQKRDGWTAYVLREFDRIMKPRFASRRPAFVGQIPPEASWGELHLSNLASFEVTFLRPDSDKLDIPAEVLPAIFRILRTGLERAAGMLADIDTTYWRTTTFIPENAAGQVHLGDLDKHLLWIVGLFDRLAADNQELARGEIHRWPSDEQFFFDKLHLYAWSKPHLCTASEVAAGVLRLSDASFWNSYQRRELLHALAGRWSEIETVSRERIEARILAGPPRVEAEPEAEYARRKAISAAKILGWLQSHGASLGESTLRTLPDLRGADPRWQPSWDERADASSAVRSGYVRVESEPAEILDVPLAEIIAKATEHSGRGVTEFTTYDPFRGLVERRPRRALSALSFEARREQYPTQYWQTLLQWWPEKCSARLRWAVANRLVRLPSRIIMELRFAAANWYEKHLPELSQQSLDRALHLWDKLLEHLSTNPPEAAESALGDTYIGGEPQGRSTRTHEHALNSPVGRLARTLITILDNTKPAAGARIPEPIRSRLAVLLASNQPGRDYSISEMTSSLTWLHHVDPDWTNEQLIPLFEPSGPDAEPAWSGYQYDRQAPPPLFALLKPHFLKIFPSLSKWRWDDSGLRHFSELVVVYCFWRETDDRYLSYSEARALLQQSTDAGRSNAAWMLARVVKSEHGWQSFGKPFLLNAWPRERRFQTSSISIHLAEVAGAANGDFPDAVNTLLPLLVPIDHPEVILHEAADESSSEDIALRPHRRFPEAYLSLIDCLISRESLSGTFGLGAALHALAEAAPALRQDPRWRRLNDISNRS